MHSTVDIFLKKLKKLGFQELTKTNFFPYMFHRIKVIRIKKCTGFSYFGAQLLSAGRRPADT